MLKTLYELGIHGCIEEFTAYQILMYMNGRNKSGTPFHCYNSIWGSDAIWIADLNFLVGRLTKKQKSSESIKQALEMQKALSTNNYHSFFSLYTDAVNMGAYVIDQFADRERAKALMIMSKACVLVPLPLAPLTLLHQVFATAFGVYLQRARIRDHG